MWANAAKMPPEVWYEMYVKPWHPELAMVGMRVLFQVISASACERNLNWSAHTGRHINTKIRSKLSPETIVYVYSNSKIATTVRNADELKRFSCDNEDALPGPHLCGVLSGVARPGQPDTL